MNNSAITDNNTSQKRMKKRPPKNVSMKKIIETGQNVANMKIGLTELSPSAAHNREQI